MRSGQFSRAGRFRYVQARVSLGCIPNMPCPAPARARARREPNRPLLQVRKNKKAPPVATARSRYPPGAPVAGCETSNRCPIIESFNARLRDELLDGEIFYTLHGAQIVIESWRRHYNHVRPNASIGYRAPAPEVFVPALAAWPAAQPRPAAPAMLPLAPRPALN